MRIGRIILMMMLLVIGFIGGQAWQAHQSERTASSQSEGQGSAESDTSVTQVNDEPPVAVILDGEAATIKLFERAAPSVVFITSIDLRRDYRTWNVFEIPQGSGSGFVWDDAGHIVTNYHVIRGGKKAQVILSDQTAWEAQIIGIAPDKDLAVLQIDVPPGKLTPIQKGISSNLKVGQSVFAIGNPFGLDHSLTTGVVSALGREIESLGGLPIRGAIQTDAAINPGNSGGPLLNSSGEIIGVNTQIYSPSGANAGIGFAIPIDEVSWVVPDLIEFGKVKRPVLGVDLVAASNVERMGLTGALVFSVAPNSAAAEAGILPTRRTRLGQIELGDLIVMVDDKEIKSNADLILALEKYQPDEVVHLKVIRNNKEEEVLVKLKESTQ